MANQTTQGLLGGFTDTANNVVGQLTVAQMTIKYPGFVLKTPTKHFAFPFKGHTVNFQKGVPMVCPADLAAALAAASAPVV